MLGRAGSVLPSSAAMHPKPDFPGSPKAKNNPFIHKCPGSHGEKVGKGLGQYKELGMLSFSGTLPECFGLGAAHLLETNCAGLFCVTHSLLPLENVTQKINLLTKNLQTGGNFLRRYLSVQLPILQLLW